MESRSLPISALGFRARGRRLVLRGLVARSTVSTTGNDGIDGAFASSERRCHSLLSPRPLRIEPIRVKVPRAKTDIVTIDKRASAMMFVWRRLITYCWKIGRAHV